MELRFDLSRESGFRYTCNRCKRCCRDKRIMLNPYELIRLARSRGLSIAQLIDDHTDEGGSILRFGGPDNACGFLGPEGCTVHADRPLVCRLYPLGRFVQPDIGEIYALLEGHPESAGVFAGQNELVPGDTVGAYVDSQGASPFIAASEKYFALFQFIRAAAERDKSTPSDIGPYGIHWLLADEIAEAHCSEHGLEAPDSAESVMEFHITALTEWVRGQEVPLD
jgi:Fe-S-cluster containining protein